MNVRILISFLSALLMWCGTSSAQDSLSVGQSRKPVGFDAGRLLNAGRSRAADASIFTDERFSDNLFLSLVARTRVPYSKDYGFTYTAGLGITKWCARSFGVRLEALGGYVPQNRDGGVGAELDVSASVLFNLSSYIGGYDLGRFCNISAVLGTGYSYVQSTNRGHFLTGNFGVNVRMKVSKRLSVDVEPYIPMRFGARGFSYGFGTSMGMSCDFSRNASCPPCAGHYFIMLSGGLQLQNSALMREASAGDFAGMRFDIGFGRRFADYFDLRLAGAYSRNTWLMYSNGTRMPAEYYTLRLEGVIDVVRLLRGRKEESTRFGAGVLAGPEAGLMLKKDLDMTLRKFYVGLAAGLHGDCRIGESVSLFIEPRFLLVPYTAPNDISTSANLNRNYYDALLNLILGIEINLK